MKKSILQGLVVVALFTLGMGSAQGQLSTGNIFWRNSTLSGDWFTGTDGIVGTGQWRDGSNNIVNPPSSTSRVYLTLSSTATAGGTIRFNLDDLGETYKPYSILSIEYRHGGPGPVTIDLDENELVLTRTAGPALWANPVATANGTDTEIILTNGNLTMTGTTITLSDNASRTEGSATLTIRNATVNATNSANHTFSIGAAAGTSGILRIENGGTLIASSGWAWNSQTVGTNGGHGEVYVNGTGTLAFNSESFILAGSSSTAKMEVTGGGTVSGVKALRVAWATPPSAGGTAASLLIEGSRTAGETTVYSSLTADRVDIGRSGESFGAEGIITLRDGGLLTVSSSSSSDYLQVRNKGILEIDGGRVVVNQTGNATAVTFDDTTTYKLTLHDKNATPFLVQNTNVDLGNAELELSLTEGFTANDWDVFTIMNYSGQSLGGTTFSNFVNGDLVQLSEGGNDYDFWFYYNYNNTDQIALVLIPEPHTMGLILLGLGAVALRRRVKTRNQ